MRITFSSTPTPSSLKFIFLIFLLGAFGFHTKAQVGIGTTSPHISSILEVSSDTSGILLPRMSAAQRDAITTPAQGLMVICTDCSDTTLFMYFDGNWSPVNTQITETQLQAYLDTAGNGLIKDGNNNISPAFMPYSFKGADNLVIGDSAMSPYLAKANGQPSSSFNSYDNTILGNNAGENLDYANQTTVVGTRALENMVESFGNVVVGAEALQNNDRYTHDNTVIGTQAGQNSETSYSVLIGVNAGKEATKDHSLYIANTDTETPLIGGRFDKEKVGINKAISDLASGATLQVGGSISLANGADVDEFSTDVYLSDSSFTAVPTEGAVKAYVDSSYRSHTSRDEHLLDSSHFKVPTEAAIKAYVDSVKNTVWIKDDNYNMYTYHDPLNAIGTSQRNMILGHDAAQSNLIGDDNIAIGYESYKEGEGDENVLIGNYTGTILSDSISNGNTAMGTNAMQNISSGSFNVAFGKSALAGPTSSNDTLNFNVAIGSEAGMEALGSGNVFIGYQAGKYEQTAPLGNKLYIANSDTDTPLIGGDFNEGRVGINQSIAELQSGATFQIAGDISLANGADIEEFSTDVTLGDSSHTAVPTEAAVKAYVDSSVTNKSLIKDGQFNLYTSFDTLKNSPSVNQNIALGHHSMQNLVAGTDNIAIGYKSFTSSEGAEGNVLIGNYTGKEFLEVGSETQNNNTLVGTSAMQNTEFATANVAIGYQALQGSNLNEYDTAHNNVAVGYQAGADYNGSGSIFIGSEAGRSQLNEDNLLMIANESSTTPLIGGRFDQKRVGINRSILRLTSGATFQVEGDISLVNGVNIEEFSNDYELSDSSNTSVPTEAAVKSYVDQVFSENTGLTLEGTGNVHGDNDNFINVTDFNEATYNTALGYNALQALTTGDHNVAIGNQTLTATTDGAYNVAIGSEALKMVSTGGANIGIGRSTGNATTTGYQNVFIGRKAGELNTTGSNNVYLGTLAGNNNQSGTKNVMIGFNAGSTEIGSDKLYIANSNTSAPMIGGDFATGRVGIGRTMTQLQSGETFQVNGNASKNAAGSWAGNSDKRLKKNIHYLNPEEILESLLQMKGATYEWNDTVTGTIRPKGVQHGFIAQDIEQVWPSKITKDGQGYLMTAYGDYDPMFVEAIKALNSKIELLENENAALKAEKKNAQSLLDKETAKLKKEMMAIYAELDQLRQNNSSQQGTH